MIRVSSVLKEMPVVRWMGYLLEAGTVRLVSVVLSGVAGVLITRSLSLDDRGEYFFILSGIALISQLAGLGLHTGNAWILARDSGSRKLALFLSFLVSSLCVLVVWVWLTLSESFSWLLLGGASVFSFFSTFNAVLLPGVIALGKNRHYSYALVSQGGFLFCGVVLIRLLVPEVKSVYFLWVAAVASLAGSLVILKSLLGNVSFCEFEPREPGRTESARLTFSAKRITGLLRYCWRAYAICLMGVATLRIGPLVLGAYDKNEMLGEFAVAQQVIDLLAIGPGTIALLVFPKFVQANSGNIHRSLRFGALSVGIAILFSCVAIVAMPYAIRWLFGMQYEGAFPILISLLPGLVVGSLLSVLSQKIAAEGLPGALVITWVAGGCLYGGFLWFMGSNVSAVSLGWSYSGLMAVLLIPISWIALRLSGQSCR